LCIMFLQRVVACTRQNLAKSSVFSKQAKFLSPHLQNERYFCSTKEDLSDSASNKEDNKKKQNKTTPLKTVKADVTEKNSSRQNSSNNRNRPPRGRGGGDSMRINQPGAVMKEEAMNKTRRRPARRHQLAEQSKKIGLTRTGKTGETRKDRDMPYCHFRKVLIPNTEVGRIIGKGGWTRDTIMKSTDTSISYKRRQIQKGEQPMEHGTDTEFFIAGYTMPSVVACREVIKGLAGERPGHVSMFDHVRNTLSTQLGREVEIPEEAMTRYKAAITRDGGDAEGREGGRGGYRRGGEPGKTGGGKGPRQKRDNVPMRLKNKYDLEEEDTALCRVHDVHSNDVTKVQKGLKTGMWGKTKDDVPS